MINATRIFLLVTPLFLFSCDGYEFVRTDAFPYGNQRTAGSGYAYVLAKMLPPKTQPILRAVEPRSAPAPMVAPPVEYQKADDMFREQLSK